MDRAIRDFPISERPAASIIGREILAFAATCVLHPLGWRTKTARKTPRRRDQRTVVLVPGYLANRTALLPLAGYLRARGISSLTYEYASGEGIERGAIGLRKFLRRHVRGGRVDLVGHSLGGLVSRAYVQELGGARRVDRCITLGTPHRGTYSAYWLTSRVARELRPDSRLLARLEASREGAASVRFTSIVAGSDNIVVPRVFASGHEDTVHLPDLGHMGLLFSARAFRAVADRLVT